MKIQELIDKKIAEDNAKDRANRIPSGKYKPSLLGACYRRQWYAKNNEPQSNPPDERSNRVFHVGKLFHQFVQQFYPIEQTEVLCEDAKGTCKGYADIVTADAVIDIKSEHSRAFHYRRKRVLCTFEDGTNTRVDDGVKLGDEVKVGRAKKKAWKLEPISIIEDRKNHWLQVCYYAICLEKEFCKMVYVSKDDLCIEEYTLKSSQLWDLVHQELKVLEGLSSLPEPKPRLYGGDEEDGEIPKECGYCSWKDTCFKQQKGE
jgi:hypothetical protein